MIYIVAGIPRSGTTLLMNMLYKGGLPVYAETTVGFEHPDVMKLPNDSRWLLECHGKAVKVLDPQIYRLPKGLEYRTIFMTRNAKEQAKSMAKLLESQGHAITSKERRAIVPGIKRDRKLALAHLQERGPVMTVPFEYLVQSPAGVVLEAQKFYGVSLNLRSAISVVIQRGPECLPQLLEIDLVGR